MHERRGRVGVYGSALLLGCSLLSACGSSESSNEPNAPAANGGSAGSASAGSAGQATGGSGSAGSSGSGGSAGSSGSGGIVLGDSLTDACILYAWASCKRNSECIGYTTDCLSGTEACPDVVTSPGSTRTAEGLRACAEEYETFPCEKILAGELPACVTPGTRLDGEICRFSSQCASLACNSDGGCGTCATVVGEGEDCTSTSVACPPQFTCDVSLGCTAPAGGFGTEPRAGVNESCETASCDYDLDCDPGTRTCVPFPGLGMSCATPRSCDFESDTYCELDGLVCKAYPGLGQPCGVDGFAGTAGYCVEGTLCHRSSESAGICEAPPAVGQPCFLDPTTLEPILYSCGTAGRCDTSVAPAVCAARLGAGQACSGDYACAADLSCLCANWPDCTQLVCGEQRFGKQSCAGPGEICHPGYACVAGVCEGIDSQGIYAEACE